MEVIMAAVMSNSDKGFRNRIDALSRHFGPGAAVQPRDPNPPFQRIPGLYGAKRIAEAVVEAAKRDLTFDEAVKVAESLYDDAHDNVVRTADKTETQKKLESELQSEMNVASKTLSTGMIFDGKELKTIGVDAIDMTEFMDPEDLSVEGKRRLGMLPADFDPELDDEKAMSRDIRRLPKGIIELDADGFPHVRCPECEGSDVYQTGGDEWSCFSCPKECKDSDACFSTDLNLNDFHGDDEDGDGGSETIPEPVRA